ncbi:MAG: aldehyde dehydrogenase family protein [Myxococcota bacterium]|nr:aldehyde dehydrogenase family protein [Myxococcota bacterium]
MRDFLTELGIEENNSGVIIGDLREANGEVIESISPVDGQVIAKVQMGTAEDYDKVVAKAVAAFETWRMVPAPKRGEIIRQMGMLLRDKKTALGKLVSLEVGKILPEGEGEVQEMIDIADFAVGLSRQLYGLDIKSERPLHRLVEQWHPLGPIGIISAFNFPVAVWSWNAFLAGVCGDSMIWKPSEKAPLCGIACQKIAEQVLGDHGYEGVMGMIVGTADPVGEKMIHDERLPLISATGSTRMGRRVGAVVAERFGKSILELGGNNALVVMDDAKLDLALSGVLFGAVGTAGQRCTTTRRLLLHKDIADEFLTRLMKAYEQVPIGSPLDEKTLMGPLIDEQAVQQMQDTLAQVADQGGEILYGGERLEGDAYPGGCYVKPAIVKAHPGMDVVKDETFAPILYVMTFETLQEAIAIQNGVKQGLSSAIFTESMRSAETFVSAMGSDCGIANVNVGTSGAEIGGAFGGEKETGGGRESGSDSWKAYMRRQTQTTNWSEELPLAQGIEFG